MQPVRILVVEDDPDDRELIGRYLRAMRKLPSDVVFARNRHEAEAILEHEAFNIVLLDMKLPNGRGIDVLKTMRRARKSAPAIVLTGFVNPSDKLEAMREGAQGYIDKGTLTAAGLETTLEEGLARHEGRIRDIEAAAALSRRVHAE